MTRIGSVPSVVVFSVKILDSASTTKVTRSELYEMRVVVVLLALAVCALPFPATAQSTGKIYANVDIDRIGHERLEALKALPGLEWWVELDRELLACLDREALPALAAGYRYRVVAEDADPSELCVFYGRGARKSGATVLAKGGRAAVLLASPAERARLEHDDHGHEDVPHAAHNTVAPFTPNAVLAHQAANDPQVRGAGAASFDVAVQALVDSVNGPRWHADVATLGGFNRWTRGSGIAAARDWLVSQFQAMPGLTVTTQTFTVPGSPSVTGYNVVATLTGTTRPDDWYIVGGHYDAISTNDGHASAPGCEDNGSGTAAVLEMARIFTANPPDATVIFMCYSGEEQGLYGSTDHASDLVATNDDEKVQAVLTMDMIGYTGDADYDCLLETNSTGQFMIDAYSAAAAQYTSLRIVTSLNPFGSDHMPYLNRGMPAMLTIENDYTSYPAYHRSTDTINNVNLTMGAETIKMNVAALAQMIGTVPAGNGSETIGVYDPSTSSFFLRNANAPGGADAVFTFGAGGQGFVPLVGDWNGDGADTVGLYAPSTGTFFLRNANSPGAADVVFSFGAGGQGFVPLVGDWDANGTDTVGIYAPATGAFFLRNSNTPGGADIIFTYGPANATPIAGDWDGNGTDTVGVYTGSTGTFFLRNANSPGPADLFFSFGPSALGWTPLPGDWNSDNASTVGLYQPGAGNFYLRNSNSPGAATTVFGYGPPSGMVPVRGDWDEQ
jgi:hypothetical protein